MGNSKAYEHKEAIDRYQQAKELVAFFRRCGAFDIFVDENGELTDYTMETQKRVLDCIKNAGNMMKDIEGEYSMSGEEARELSVESSSKHGGPYTRGFNRLFAVKMKELGVDWQRDRVNRNTRKEIPDFVSLLLSYGPKFALPLEFGREQYDEIKESIMNIASIYNVGLRNYDYTELARLHQEYVRSRPGMYTQINRTLKTALRETVEFLDQNKDLKVVATDKTKRMMIMDTKEYREKMSEMMNDADMYAKLGEGASSLKAHRKLNERYLKLLGERGLISEVKIRVALSKEDKYARIYGVVKDHKEGLPLRPVVNTRSAPMYTVAGLLSDVFTQLRETHKYNVLSAEHFRELLDESPFADEYVMRTADVKSMFSNITRDMVERAIRKRYPKIKERLDVPLEELLKMVNMVAFYASELEYDEQLYKQKRGLKMGSRLSTILADWVMEDQMDEAAMKVKAPKVMAKFVDDIYVMDEETVVKNYLHQLGAAHETIKLEETEEGPEGINFLNLTVVRKKGRVVTRWYRKPYASTRILNANSGHPEMMITNTAKEYVHTMIALSHTEYHGEIYRTAEQILRENGFGEDYIRRIINEVCRERPNRGGTKKDPSQLKRKYAAIDYVPGVSRGLAGMLMGGTDLDLVVAERPTGKMSKILDRQNY